MMSDSRADMSLANVAATSLAKGHSQDVIKKFHWAIKRVASEHGNENDTALTQEELIELIRVWEPQRDNICLYVKWARQLRRNFNLDSIATLLCLSRHENDTALTQEERIQLICVSEPQRDIIGLYVRWAPQLRRNFNLDSIATLLCLSCQCNYTAPVNFLSCKVKTLSIHKNQKAAYRESFHFDIPNRKDIN